MNRLLIIISGIVFIMFSLISCKSHSQETTKAAHSNKVCEAAQPVIIISEDKYQK